MVVGQGEDVEVFPGLFAAFTGLEVGDEEIGAGLIGDFCGPAGIVLGEEGADRGVAGLNICVLS